MNVIQYDVEETKGKVKDIVTHLTAGPGGCISIVTHEQYREVKRDMSSGVIAPGISSNYQRTRFQDLRKFNDPQIDLNSFRDKIYDVNRKRTTKSVCTSTGDLCQKSFKSFVLRSKTKNLKTQTTQTENPSDPDQTNASTSFRKKKKGKKKNGVCRKEKKRKRTENKEERGKGVKLRRDGCEDESMTENDSVAGPANVSYGSCENTSTEAPASDLQSSCEPQELQESPDQNL